MNLDRNNMECRSYEGDFKPIHPVTLSEIHFSGSVSYPLDIDITTWK